MTEIARSGVVRAGADRSRFRVTPDLGKVCPSMSGDYLLIFQIPEIGPLTPPADLGTQVMHKLWQSHFGRLNFLAISMI
jgi:hypothetical protein